MIDANVDRFSAGEQGLGYIYQPRLALLKLLELPEDTSVLIEKDDDLDFVASSGIKSLASLKHKAAGGRLTDSSTDFWKSVRIWLARYARDGRITSTLRFFLFTTELIPQTSFLCRFVLDKRSENPARGASADALEVLAQSASKLLESIAAELKQLDGVELEDFLSRITIVDSSPRIVDVPTIIKEQHMRSIRREFRAAVFERLEGWWNETTIGLLSGVRTDPIFGYEVSDKLSALSEEYRSDNLPITFRGKAPQGEIDTENDHRLFVIQLREIGIASSRIRSAILDYYRAFEQRSHWARERLVVASELEEYEDRLIEEWGRYKDVVFENLDDESAEAVLVEAGRALYNWADMQSGNIESLRIRARVTEPYVLRGGFHILANRAPTPQVFWHPRFLSRISELLSAVP